MGGMVAQFIDGIQMMIGWKRIDDQYGLRCFNKIAQA
jgi:hypothetical protein